MTYRISIAGSDATGQPLHNQLLSSVAHIPAVDPRALPTMQHGAGIASLAPIYGPTPSQRAGSLFRFTTPEEMFDAQKAGLPRWDIDAMTRAGTMARARNDGPTSARSIGFITPHGDLTPQQLIAAVRNIDVRRLPHAGITPTAVFDFDNTIIGGDVFFDFVVLLCLRTQLPPMNAPRVGRLFEKLSEGKVTARSLEGSTTNEIVSRALAMVKDEKLSLSNCFFLVIGALAGVRESVVTEVARELFVVGVPGKPPYATRFFNHDKPEASAETLIRTLINRGVAPHIITLGIPTVAREGAKLVGIPPSHVHGFELEVIGGIITGRAVDARVVGKHMVSDHLVSRYPLFSFGDSVSSDTPMLARATVRAFAVEPDAAFKAHIAKNHADITGLSYKS